MEILKNIYYVLDYTLQFAMWLVIGRLAAQITIRNPNNFVVMMFVRFTEPLYRFIKKVLPFARVQEENRETLWGQIEGRVALILILLIYVIIRPVIRIMISVIIVNLGSS